jgi:hypothetical protein
LYFVPGLGGIEIIKFFIGNHTNQPHKPSQPPQPGESKNPLQVKVKMIDAVTKCCFIVLLPRF